MAEDKFRFRIMKNSIQIRQPAIKGIAKSTQFCHRGAFRRLLVATSFVALFLLVGTERDFRIEAFNLKEFLFSSIPSHPYLNKIGESSFISNGMKIILENYRGQNISLPQVMEYYKKILLERGYEIDNESSDSGYAGVNFISKDKGFINIAAYEGRLFQKPEYIFVKLTRNEGGLAKITDYYSSKDEDMPGEDIPWLKRYPKARRASSTITDNGMATIGYLLDNESCLQCVVSFYKEEMLKNGWLLEGENHKTKDEEIQKSTLDINQLRKQFKNSNLPAEQKENLEELLVKLEPIIEQSKEYVEKVAANESITLKFKKVESRCAIAVDYREIKPKEERFSPEFLNILEKSIQSAPEIIGNNLRRNYGLDAKETIAITVIYTPSLKALEGQKTWF